MPSPLPPPAKGSAADVAFIDCNQLQNAGKSLVVFLHNRLPEGSIMSACTLAHCTAIRKLAPSVVASLLLAAVGLPLHAANIPWTNTSGGNFNTAGNWNSGAGPVPGAADTAQFNIGNIYTVTFNVSLANSVLSVGGSAVSFRPDTVASRTYSVASAQISSGTLFLTAPTIGSNTLNLDINSSLTVFSGRLLSIAAGNDVACTTLNLATNGAGTGTVLVDGAGSTLAVSGDTFTGLTGGIANLTLQNNAVGTFGTMTVANSGQTGSGGNVRVQSGADINSLGSLNLGIGAATGQVSTFLVTGTGSSVTQTGGASLTVGSGFAGSSATLELAANGTFITGTGATTVAANGMIDINGGTLDARGNIVVTGGQFTQTSGSFFWDTASNFTVQSGGVVSLLGFTTPVASIISVRNPGSQFNTSLALSVVGSSQITVSDGADLVSANFLDIATSGNGTVIVDGLGSSATANGAGNSFVGTDGNGTLTFRNAATGSLPGGLRIAGTTAGSTGTLNVESGASLATGTLQVGNIGSTTSVATVNLSNASISVSGANAVTIGLISNTDLPDSINVNAGGTLAVGAGTTTVNPSGRLNVTSGTFTTNGPLNISGIVNLSSTATVTQQPAAATTLFSGGVLNITRSTVSLGTVTGQGGVINFNSGSLSVAGNAVLSATSAFGPVLDLDPSRALAVASSTIITPQSQLILSGGRLTTGTLDNTGTFTFTSGTLTLTGPGLNIGTGGALGPIVSASAGQTFNINGLTTISSSGTLLIADGTFNAIGGISNSGEIRLAGLVPMLAGNVIFNAKLIRGDGRIHNNLTNNPTGEIRAQAGDTLLLTGVNGTNAGRINLQGGTLQFTQSLTNGASGKITGTGFLYADSGLTNLGEIQFSAGFTSVYGTVTNNNKITVSGGGTTTFYDPVVMSPGSTFQTSTNSTSVFFGPVTGTGSFTGPGVKIFEAGGPGSLLGAIATITGTTRVGPGTTVETGSFHEASVLIEGTLLLTPNLNTAQNTNRTSFLQIDPGGLLELTDNNLLVDYSATSPISTLISYFTSGQMTASGDASGLPTYLAIAESSDLGLTEFNGIAIDDTTVIAKYTYVGDANLDGQVDALDYERVDLAIGNSGVFGTAQGDLNYDGNVDALDYEQIDLNIGNGVGSPLASGPAAVFIPEPGLTGVISGIVLLATRRPRRAAPFHGQSFC
jgi:T5SS/PEP-CTERM-associated repeat protein